MPYTQENRPIAIDTPLGEDALLLRGFTGQEGISRLFSFDLDLLAESSLSFNEIVGQRVTIRVDLDDSGRRRRYINGFVRRVARGGSDARFPHCRAAIVRWL